jgi:hypothetical protein
LEPNRQKATEVPSSFEFVRELAHWNSERQIVVIPIEKRDSKRRITCIVSRETFEVLDRTANLDRTACLAAIGRHHARLAAVVARRLALYGADPDDTVRITSTDVEGCAA